MDYFKKAKVVRFRSHHNKYLLAADDEVSVWQDRDGTVNNARWTVELIDENSKTLLRLKSCYGKYLTALSTPYILGIKCKKVLQTLPKTLDSVVEWEPVREGFKVKLKTASGQYLRAHGCSVPPWKDSISHDIPCKRSTTKEWVLWDVDIVEIRTDQQQEEEVTTNIKNANASSTAHDQDPPPPISHSESSQTQPGSPAEIDLASPNHNSPSDEKHT